MVLSFLVTAALILASGSIVYKSWRNGISPMPSSAIVRREVVNELNQLPAKQQGLLVDAGSGWGTLALQVARSRSDLRIIGLENSPLPLGVSRLLRIFSHWSASRTDKQGSPVCFLRQNLYSYSYEDADYVVCYLYPAAMKRLSPILRQSLASGAVVISICFALPDWEPAKRITCKDLYRTPIYIYRS